MWTWIIEKLMEYYPQIAGYACLIFVVVFITIKIYKFYFSTKSVCEKFESFSDTLNTISRGLETLNKILLEKKVIDNSCYSETHSPIDLNELGNQLYKESGAEQVFGENEERLLEELEKKL